MTFPPHFLSLCARRLTFHTSGNVQSLLEWMANRIALFETSVFYYIHVKADGKHFIVCERVDSFSIWNVNSECQSDTSPGAVSFVFIVGESVGMWVSLKCWRKLLIWMILGNLLDLPGQSQLQWVIIIAAFMEATKNTVKTVIFESIRAYQNDFWHWRLE